MNLQLRSSCNVRTHLSPRVALRAVPRRCSRVLNRAEEQGAESRSPAAATGQPQPAQQAQPSTSAPLPSPSFGGGIAAGAAVAAVVAFAVGRLFSGGPSLAMLEEGSVPLEVALRNNKPTVIEFYANWCEVCRELVPEEYKVEQQYRDDINFVMLNIENTKWAPEVAEYGVGGIPHFVFMDPDNKTLAAAVGRLPNQVLEGNVAALSKGRELPFLKARGQVSSLTPPGQGAMAGPGKQTGPRDHA